MFRIMLLLCYSLIDTNTNPFYFSLSQIGREEPRTQRFGLALSFRRFPYSFYESYRMGDHLLLLLWCLSSYKQWYCLNMMRLWDSKGSVNLLRINCVLPTNLHTRRDTFVDSKGSVNLLRINCVSLTNSHTLHGAFEEINPPVGLSSIHSPTLGRVWYHAPWWQRYRRYRRCGWHLFGHLLW